MIARIRLTLVIFFSIILISCHGAGIGQNLTDTQPPYGKYRFYKFKIGNKPVGMTDGEIKAIIGKYIVINKNKAIFIHDTCNSPKYELTKENDDYFNNYHQIDKKELGVTSKESWVLHLDCEIEPKYSSSESPEFSSQFIIVSKRIMIINLNGVYFYLQKQQ